LYPLYDRFNDSIMVLSFPQLPYLPWTSKKNPKSQYPTDAIEPYCFSHWPGANCFITHFCASRKQKEKMRLVHGDMLVQMNATRSVEEIPLRVLEEEAKHRQAPPLCPPAPT
jgi:hypothetical protein